MSVSYDVFLMSYSELLSQVIHTQVVDFHEAFRAAKSLDEMIQLHDEQ